MELEEEKNSKLARNLKKASEVYELNLSALNKI